MDSLTSYRDTNVRESVPDRPHRAPTTVRGVKICCYGEVKFHGSEPFVSVDFTQANRSFLGRGFISPISVCLRMPLRFWNDPGTEFRHGPLGWEEAVMPDSNPNVGFLMMETGPLEDGWVRAPLEWNTDIGNVWAVREDGQDLAVKDIEMMCHFARQNFQPMFEEVMELGSSLADRQRVVDFITWDNMVTHWKETSNHSAILLAEDSKFLL